MKTILRTKTCLEDEDNLEDKDCLEDKDNLEDEDILEDKDNLDNENDLEDGVCPCKDVHWYLCNGATGDATI